MMQHLIPYDIDSLALLFPFHNSSSSIIVLNDEQSLVDQRTHTWEVGVHGVSPEYPRTSTTCDMPIVPIKSLLVAVRTSAV